MNNYLLKDSHTEEIFGIIITDKSAREIQNIIDEVKSKYEGTYTIDDILDAIKEKCMELDIMFKYISGNDILTF